MDVLDIIGIQTEKWALVGLNGKDVYAEPRGLKAGYHWPQYSVHRGGLQMPPLQGGAREDRRRRHPQRAAGDRTQDWIDLPAMLRDAAHVMYPTGSNGASQAVIDARVLGAVLLEHGVTPGALQAYDAKLCKDVSAVVLRNRGAGPFGLLNLLDEHCGGVFDEIESVIPLAERNEFMRTYQAAAGFAIEKLNGSPPILPARTARVAPRVRLARGSAT